MATDRRDFVAALGSFLAASVAFGQTLGSLACRTCYEPVEPEGVLFAEWENLRRCWLGLKDPRMQTEAVGAYVKDLRERHEKALEVLVGGGKVSRPVAGQLQAVFLQALAHMQRQLATCYQGESPEFGPRQDLINQAEALAEMAGKCGIADKTVRKAEEALRRDVEWLNRFSRGLKSGKPEAIEVSPEAAEAARILVGLLLEGEPDPGPNPGSK